jgi:hypothetical protein
MVEVMTGIVSTKTTFGCVKKVTYSTLVFPSIFSSSYFYRNSYSVNERLFAGLGCKCSLKEKSHKEEFRNFCTYVR